MNEYQEKAVKNYIKTYNCFDIEGMLNDLHPDIIFENVRFATKYATNDNVI